VTNDFKESAIALGFLIRYNDTVGGLATQANTT
jgi:hypothetical protein